MEIMEVVDKLDKLEEMIRGFGGKISVLEKENARLKAVNDCQNLMCKYRYWHTGGKFEDISRMIAQHTPGVRVELANSGVFEGYEGAKRVLVDFPSFTQEKAPKAYLDALMITTPVIEVAADCKTARGLWTAFGPITKGHKELEAQWSLEQYAVDFVKEDEIWKIWHMHLFYVLRADYHKSWVEVEPIDLVRSGLKESPKEFRSDRPSTYFTMYSTKDIPSSNMAEFVPPPPQPYETFEEWMACVPKDE